MTVRDLCLFLSQQRPGADEGKINGVPYRFCCENSNAISAREEVNNIPSFYDEESCDIFKGEWIHNPHAPYYTNNTCWAIHEHQNCMKYGRPDSEFMKWKWKPHGCDLPEFDPLLFLNMVRDKSLAFVGDSVGRNHMQSMICLLSKVDYPIDISPTKDPNFGQWKYVNYNFTMSYYWSPFLVRYEERDPDGPTHTGLFNVYLDEIDETWVTQMEEFDYIILNAGHWFSRTSVYYENRRITGCRYCQLPNVTDLPTTHGFRHAFRTAFKAINGRENFKGLLFLRTIAPPHFEGGSWNDGGNCVRTRPFRSNEIGLDGLNLDLYRIQLEEFKAVQRELWRVLDTTQAMLLRPDGHPSRFGHWPEENVTLYNDCVHWCLPGPIDSWADLLYHMIMIEEQRSIKPRLNLNHKRL